MSIEEIVQAINAEVEKFNAESEEVVKGNKAAARRARKITMIIEKLGKDFRKETIK